MDLISLLLLALVFVAALVWLLRPDPRLPPFPVKPWPIVGHLFTLEADPRAQFNKWHQQVGDMFSLYMAGTNVVVFNTYDLLKETFVKRADEFSDRPHLQYDDATGLPGKGVIMSWGPDWKEQRATTFSILRSFGMGKNIMEDNIVDECNHFFEQLEKLKGEATNIVNITNRSMANIICSVVIGQRLEYDDPVFKELVDIARHVVGEGSASGLLTYLPSLQYLPGDFFGAKEYAKHVQDIMGLFVNKFVNLKKDNDDSGENFIAAYMKEWAEKSKANKATTMSEEHLVKIVFDLFVAGSVTTATTIVWCILYAVNYPEIQRRVFEEIEREVGLNRPLSMQDRNSLPYLTAFISESQRMANVGALALPHELKQDTPVRGYTLPKGTQVIPNFDSLVYDPKIWGKDVMEFKPERFLDQNHKYTAPEQFTIFGMGRRTCTGESLAKMIVFLYVGQMLQRFSFEAENPACPPSMEGVFGMDVNPRPFKVKVLDRRATA